MQSYAADLGMDPAKLQECIDSEQAHKVIEQQGKLGKTVGVDSTPAIFVNGKRLRGGANINNLQSVYERVQAIKTK